MNKERNFDYVIITVLFFAAMYFISVALCNPIN